MGMQWNDTIVQSNLPEFLKTQFLSPLITYTAKNTVISPNFLVWKFCGKAQFSHSFGRIARNFVETHDSPLQRSLLHAPEQKQWVILLEIMNNPCR